MKLLLDTHVLLWAATEADRLAPGARRALEDGGNEAIVSVVAAWEVAIKQSLGKFDLPQPAELWLPDVPAGPGSSWRILRSWRPSAFAACLGIIGTRSTD